VGIERGIDGAQPIRSERIERLAGREEERRAARTRRLGSGTLACPSCDAPVALSGRAVSPADPLGCPVCSHAGAVRDFLSLARPTRPARVELYVVPRARLTA
jgi:hypothetical protein